MQKDERISKLVRKVLTESLNLRPGEKVYLEFEGEQTLPVMEEFIRQTIKLGAVPFYFFNDTVHHIAVTQGASEEQMFAFGRLHAQIMEQMDAYVVVRGYSNPFNKSVLTAEEQSLYNRGFMGQVHFDVRVPKTRWIVLRWPTNVAAALAKMTTPEMEDFYFNACLLDYQRMGQAMQPLVELMNKTDKVHIMAPNTDLKFSIRGIPATVSNGARNLPDGEVFTSPVKNSISGRITFNTNAVINGESFAGISLDFEQGRVFNADAKSGDVEKLRRIIATDDGSCYIGEFAFGVNPHVTREICEGLFDEKISGSIHMALGNSIPSSDNGNRSSIHWDLIQIQTPACGGGSIWFDDVLIRRDGRFVLPELEGLNPENLR